MAPFPFQEVHDAAAFRFRALGERQEPSPAAGVNAERTAVVAHDFIEVRAVIKDDVGDDGKIPQTGVAAPKAAERVVLPPVSLRPPRFSQLFVGRIAAVFDLLPDLPGFRGIVDEIHAGTKVYPIPPGNGANPERKTRNIRSHLDFST